MRPIGATCVLHKVWEDQFPYPEEAWQCFPGLLLNAAVTILAPLYPLVQYENSVALTLQGISVTVFTLIRS